METNSKLIKAMENIEDKKRYFVSCKKIEENARWKFGLGLLGAAYLGARVFIGPEIMDNLVNNFGDFLSVADMGAMFLTFSGGIFGGLDYKLKHEERQKYQKDFRKTLFEYRKLIEDEYPRAMRALKK